MPRPSDDVISGREAMLLDRPWIVPEAFTHLQDIVQKPWKVFEWGSGGSTVWFAKNCQKVVSIETNLRWYIWTWERLRQLGLDETGLYFLPKPGGEMYINTIEAFPDAYFNLIFVDGETEVREACLETAVRKLKGDGILLWDNSNLGEGKAVRDGLWQEWMYVTEAFQWLGEELQMATSFLRRDAVVLAHLEAHREAGHSVPEHAFKRIKQELCQI